MDTSILLKNNSNNNNNNTNASDKKSFYEGFDEITGSIFSDFGRSDPFVIDGDGLILAIAVHGKGKSKLFDCNYRTQSLFFFHCFDWYLHNLWSRKTRFTVFFCKDNERFYKNHNLLLIRKQCIQHYCGSSFSHPDINFKLFEGDWNTDREVLNNIIEYFTQGHFMFLMTLMPLHYIDNYYDSKALKAFISESTAYFMNIVELHTLSFRGSHAHSFIYTFRGGSEGRGQLIQFKSKTNIAFKMEPEFIGHLEASNAYSRQTPRARLHIASVARLLQIRNAPAQKEVANLDNDMLYAFCLYLALMEVVPLRERTFDIPLSINKESKYQEDYFDKFKKVAESINWVTHTNFDVLLSNEDQNDLILMDMFDLKYLLFIHLHVASGTQMETAVDESVVKAAKDIWSIFTQMPRPAVAMSEFLQGSASDDQSRWAKEVLSNIANNTAVNSKFTAKLHRIHNPFLDQLNMEAVGEFVTANEALPPRVDENDQEFYAITHYHNKVLLTHPDAFTISIKDEFKTSSKYSEKGKQKSALKFFKAAQTLYDVNKKLIITNLDDDKKQQQSEESKKNYQVYKQDNSKNVKIKKKDLSTEVKDAKEKKELDTLKYNLKSADTLKKLTDALGDPQPGINYLNYAAIGLNRMSKYYKASDSKALYQLIQRFLRDLDEPFELVARGKGSEDHKDFLICLHKASKLLDINGLSNALNIKFKLGLVMLPEEGSINPIDFQLSTAHDTLIRSTEQMKDDRIKHFAPDEWQRRLLDVVDNKESALIVAPTSSGKTFISFYAFEKILKQCNDGIVVYVSPTKALVNQMYSEVLGRYEKNYENIVGSHAAARYRLAGVFTRDFRIDHENCQVLITVPQCLDLLLLSVTNSEWIHRVKYVIFDEVHQIAGGLQGALWEQLLLMNPAPFLALSATVANPDQFYEWLQHVDPDKKVHYINYQHRFNDLKMYHYTREEEGEGLRRPRYIRPIHPMDTLSTKTSTNLLLLLPEEVLSLYRQLQAKYKGRNKELNELDPYKYFANEVEKEYNLQKLKVYEYQAAVKGFIEKERIIGGEDIADALCKYTSKEYEVIPRWSIESELPGLIEDLKKKDLLPVIVFHFSRHGCEKMAKRIYQSVQAKHSDPDKDRKVSELEFKIQELKDEIKKSKPVQDDPIYKDLRELQDKLSYLTTRKAEYGTVIKDDVDDDKDSINPLQKRMLLEGIGIHHSGLGKAYAQNVEVLFRRKKIQVIIATGSLALGVNMPCRSVVIAGDSPYLNTLMFRQLSGRAGRRGFEPRGHVIFFGVSQPRANHLINSKLSDIVGNSVLSTSLTLRILSRLNLVDKMKDQATKKQDLALLLHATNKLINNSFFLRDNPAQNQFMFHFSLDYLHRQGFIDRNGQGVGYAGIISYLHYLEPYNFILASLLRDNVFSQYTQETKEHEETIIIILSYLFDRVEISPRMKKLFSKYLMKNNNLCPSIVYLPELPANAKSCIDKHNMTSVDTFKGYLSCYQEHTVDKHNLLPLLPGHSFDKGIGGADASTPTWSAHCQPYVESCMVRRGVAAINGSSNLATVSTLTKNFPVDTYFDHSLLPMCDYNVELNSYLLDFYRHQQLKTLKKANDMQEGDIYSNVKDFILVLKVIGVILELNDPTSPVTKAFLRLSSKFNDKFKSVAAFNQR
ncbi:hypothetical protein SAMD00019534_094500 [Acytostelium subglobosum LB1]|uniref:hypothetical protein n=1 Tax=Acytostelium subglobosum LB1 TaxID=1410327 RepID=UPI000644DCF8|nr:hypothetical protein SAMD00019534_094500 [Acytostelium subglobosum LB1]GAM26275.1 hypothetical protein SAMD00019534_094500 [Acytostelium subglobosum LB1]|eukprot:XP_012750829.1 hypothetical protein SAMD00019534_094500 [Acytostelium subglobosum LB1]